MPKYEKDKKKDDDASQMLGHGAARNAANEMRKSHDRKASDLNSIMDAINANRGGRKQK